ncbi:MAG: DUF4276 family protein [Verrucomicrobia bacterium]|nr:DUF4276 family protein [Verrucomicrobiota bacterium]
MKLLPTVYLAAEDEPGLAVGRRLIQDSTPLAVHREENGHGYGRLFRKAKNFQEMASLGYPVLMLTDLDAAKCAPALHRAWLGDAPRPEFLFRIAVREIEAWLLADRDGIAKFLQITVTKIPERPEQLADPKKILLDLAAHAPRRLRTGFLPAPRSSAIVGPEYNGLISRFVSNDWDLHAAASIAPSLGRAIAATRLLAARVHL